MEPDAIAYVAVRNGRPDQHIGYLGDEPADVRAALRDLDDDAIVAVSRAPDGAVDGVLGAESDPDLGRAWLLGPWASDAAVADRLYATVSARLTVAEQELFCDLRNTFVIDFADRHGFTLHSDDTTMSLDRSRWRPAPRSPAVRPLSGQWHEAVRALHAEAFPGTHRSADGVLTDGVRLVAVVDGRFAGYAQATVDGATAELAYVAVPVDRRGEGTGDALVGAVLGDVFADGTVASVHLSVRTRSTGAIRLYERHGFATDRAMRAYRRRDALLTQNAVKGVPINN